MLWEDDVNRMRRQASDREKIFAKDTSDQGLLSKINQKLITLSNREQRTNRQLKKKKKDQRPEQIPQQKKIYRWQVNI